MITQEEQKTPRPYGVYKQRHTVELTPEQIQFIESVREKRGATISQVLRQALDFWRHQAEQAG